MSVATTTSAPAPLHELLADLRHPGWGSPRWPDKFERLDAYQQVAVARIVAAFDTGYRLVLLDAPVGAGKTVIAEAVRRILRAGYTTYCCTDLALQDQFLGDFGYAANIMGRTNYPTLNRPDAFELPHNDPGRITAADCNRRPCPNRPRKGNKRWHCEKHDSALRCLEGDCSYCDPPSGCPRRIAKARAVTASLSATNTAYLLAECNHLGDGSEFSAAVGHSTGRELVILDEADMLERAIWNFEAVTISPAMRSRLGIPTPDRKTVPEAWQWWCGHEAIPAAKREADRLADAVEAGPNDVTLRRLYEQVTNLYDRLQAIEPLLGSGRWVYDYVEEGGRTTMSFKPVGVDDIAQTKLWQHSARWLCMSATLLGRDIFCDALGWSDPAAYVQMPSRFPVERRPIKVVPIADMGRKHREVSWPRMARALERLLAEHEGERVLVHCVSYKFAEYLMASVDSPRLMTYTHSSQRSEVLEQFRSTDGAVLIAASMERGIDLPYEDCRVCVVAQLNFLSLGDKQVAARSAGGRNLWYRIEMLRSLVHAVGRVHRAADDESITYIMDARFWRLYNSHREFIPSWFREALVTTGDEARRWSAA